MDGEGKTPLHAVSHIRAKDTPLPASECSRWPNRSNSFSHGVCDIPILGVGLPGSTVAHLCAVESACFHNWLNNLAARISRPLRPGVETWYVRHHSPCRCPQIQRPTAGLEVTTMVMVMIINAGGRQQETVGGDFSEKYLTSRIRCQPAVPPRYQLITCSLPRHPDA